VSHFILQSDFQSVELINMSSKPVLNKIPAKFNALNYVYSALHVFLFLIFALNRLIIICILMIWVEFFLIVRVTRRNKDMNQILEGDFYGYGGDFIKILSKYRPIEAAKIKMHYLIMIIDFVIIFIFSK
jgi:hypothetical protein